MKNIPKKQLIGAFFLFLFLGGGFLFLKDVFGNKEFNREVSMKSSNPLFVEEAEKDGDGDGLKDWEEVLWKTDPENPDSDGDGTPDGEEVRNKRNPLKPGPNDTYKSIKESPLGEAFSQTATEKNLTLTDIFARDFLTGYFALKQGGRYTEATRDNFVKTLFASIDEAPTEEKYTLADLKITKKSDADTLKNYGNEVGGSIRKFYQNFSGDELRILDNAVKKEDASELRKLEPFAESYKNLATELLRIKTPLVLETTHLELLNGYRGIGEAFSGMATIFDDPMSGAFYIKKHQGNTAFVNKAFTDLKNYFSKNGVGFKPEEDGYLFKI